MAEENVDIVQTVDTALGGTPPASSDTPGQSTPNQNPEPSDNGAPQVPETYDFTQILEEAGADLDENASKEFSEIMRGMGATQDQAAAMAKYGLGYVQNVASQVAQTMQKQYVQEVQGWGENAKTELAGAYDETVGQGAAVVDYIEGKVPGFKDMLGLTGCGNHVAMIKAMAAIAPLITEDSGQANTGSAAGTSNMYPNTDFSKY